MLLHFDAVIIKLIQASAALRQDGEALAGNLEGKNSLNFAYK